MAKNNHDDKNAKPTMRFAEGGTVPTAAEREKAVRDLASDLDLDKRTDGALARNYGRRAQDIADGVRSKAKD